MIDWGWAGRALEPPSGDLHVVAPFAGGVLVALLDGLGHGADAAEASAVAAQVLEAHAGDSVLSLVERCHAACRRTRGLVMNVASFVVQSGTMTWTGVGNVDGFLLRGENGGREAISPRSGVVGYQLPPLRSESFRVTPGDTLVFATDGIRSEFAGGIAIEYTPQEIAESIVARYARGTDDAHVVAARWRGAPP